MWNFETPEGSKSITVDGPLCTNNVVIIRDAVLAGVGVAWLPDYVIGDELRDGRLVRLLPEAKLPPILVYGIMPKQARQTATVRAVLDILGAALRAQAAKLRTEARRGASGESFASCKSVRQNPSLQERGDGRNLRSG